MPEPIARLAEGFGAERGDAAEGVTAAVDPAVAARLGTYYLVPRADVLVVVQAFTQTDAQDAISALPG